jgi:hypothetical protein
MTAASRAIQLDPERTIPDLQAVLEHAILNHDRSLQRTIGPSSLGSACDRCLITELAGLKEPDTTAPWLPTIGTAVHEWAEHAILSHLMTTGSDRYITEGRVLVGVVGGVEIWGNSDVFDTWTGTVVDFKVTGTTTLRKTTKDGGPSLTYRRQGQLYGKGWQDKGFDVRSVAVWMLPRNGFTIGSGYLWQTDYDRADAEATIARADLFARAIATFGAEQVLAKAGPHTFTEFACGDPKAEEKAAKQLDGLLIQTPSATGAGTNAA